MANASTPGQDSEFSQDGSAEVCHWLRGMRATCTDPQMHLQPSTTRATRRFTEQYICKPLYTIVWHHVRKHNTDVPTVIKY